MKIKNKGMVLVTGLIFLLVALMASLSTINNLTLLYKGQSDSLKYIQDFYQLEMLLKSIENDLILDNPALNDLDIIIENFNIKKSEEKVKPLKNTEGFIETIGKNEETHDMLVQINFLGARNTLSATDFNGSPKLAAWVFRIKVWKKDSPLYWLESLLEIIPQELNSNSVEPGKTPLATKLNVSKRIAWYEGILGE